MAKIKETPKKVIDHIASQALNKAEEKSMSVSSWTFFFHEPYKCDWKEARSKALGKKWKGIL
jgi:hypothetical protein